MRSSARHARDGWLKQPANALSNLGFVVAGLVIGWQAPRRPLRFDGLATAYACVVVLLGPASAAMHATQSALGGRLDMTSMYLVSSFAAAYALTRWWRRDRVFFWQVFLLLVAACELVGLSERVVPVFQSWGNVIFGALLVVAITVEVRLWRRGAGTPRRGGPAWRTAPARSPPSALAFAIWNASQHGLCDPALAPPGPRRLAPALRAVGVPALPAVGERGRAPTGGGCRLDSAGPL